LLAKRANFRDHCGGLGAGRAKGVKKPSSLVLPFCLFFGWERAHDTADGLKVFEGLIGTGAIGRALRGKGFLGRSAAQLLQISGQAIEPGCIHADRLGQEPMVSRQDVFGLLVPLEAKNREVIGIEPINDTRRQRRILLGIGQRRWVGSQRLPKINPDTDLGDTQLDALKACQICHRFFGQQMPSQLHRRQ
jgi:hypothetical protein